MQTIERRFVEVDGRRVHYRRMGKGPPLVMLHASPAHSEMLIEEMRAAAPYFTCFAFDTPGFGDSDALAGDRLEVRDLAAATHGAMRALGLPPCAVFGTHSGSAIGLELGAGWPDAVTGLVLEGVPIFTDDEMRDLFSDFFVTFPPDPLGAHFTSIWMRFRDQFTWFPWQSRNVQRLNPIDRPEPRDIHHWMMMYLRAADSYMPAYRAILAHGGKAVQAAAQLRVPAIFLCAQGDMLFGHLERLPPLQPDQRIERLGPDIVAKHAAIIGYLRELPASPPTLMRAPTSLAGRDPALQFLDSEDGQLFIRCYGRPENPALILLHDAPGTGLALEPLARALADIAYVILPDLPGTGDSDPPGDSRIFLDVCADAIAAIADIFALDSLMLGAIGCGCAVAASFALRGDPRLGAILVQDVPVPDPANADRVAPDFPLTAEGAHWLNMWLMLRDGQIYRPWFDGRVAAQRGEQGNFDAAWLHAQCFALMKSRQSYGHLPRAAYRTDSAGLFARAGITPHQVVQGAWRARVAAAMAMERR